MLHNFWNWCVVEKNFEDEKFSLRLWERERYPPAHKKKWQPSSRKTLSHTTKTFTATSSATACSCWDHATSSARTKPEHTCEQHLVALMCSTQQTTFTEPTEMIVSKFCESTPLTCRATTYHQHSSERATLSRAPLTVTARHQSTCTARKVSVEVSRSCSPTW